MIKAPKRHWTTAFDVVLLCRDVVDIWEHRKGASPSGFDDLLKDLGDAIQTARDENYNFDEDARHLEEAELSREHISREEGYHTSAMILKVKARMAADKDEELFDAVREIVSCCDENDLLNIARENHGIMYQDAETDSDELGSLWQELEGRIRALIRSKLQD